MADADKPGRSPGGFISTGQGAVSLLRDATLLTFGILLIAFPKVFNQMLVSAGFDKGNFMGLEWKSNLVKSNDALEDAGKTMADLQTHYADLSAKLASLSAGMTDPKVKEQLLTLEQDSAALSKHTTTAQAAVSQALVSNAPLLAQTDSSTRPSTEPQDYLVGLQTLGMPDADRVTLNDKIHAAGYRLHELSVSYQTNDPSAWSGWFAKRSTVLFYAPSAETMAKTLAQLLRNTTGQEFATQTGSGRGVDPSQRGVTLFVHYIKK